MVRTYKNKSDRVNIDELAIHSAVEDVVNGILSIRKAAKKYNLKPATLQHRIEKRKLTGKPLNAVVYSSKFSSQQVFTKEQEELLSEYIITCSKMHCGLTLRHLQSLAYEYAKKLNCKYPSNWDTAKLAGIDWTQGFRKRHINISLRKPENTSLARSAGFNKTAVEHFFSNLKKVLEKYQFTADRIINYDESGITTVLNTPKVLVSKSQKQVGQIATAERGELVTFGGIISAVGNAIPPIFVFPRVHYKNHFLSEGPEGSLGLANKSGWIVTDLFLDVLKHVQKHTSCSKSNPILMLCDNHEAHISIEAIEYSRANGIVYLTFPPHTSHRLQPLDVGVFGPFKSKLKVAFNNWHINNPGRGITIYDIPKITKTAYLESFTGKNIISDFTKAGIWPFNSLVFSEADFAPSAIYHTSTENNLATVENNLSQEKNQIKEAVPIELIPSTSRQFTPPRDVDASSSKHLTPPGTIIIPDVVRPYPKAKPKQTKRKGAEKGKSRIYTYTPEKDRLQELYEIKQKKREMKIERENIRKLKQSSKRISEQLTDEKAVKINKTKNTTYADSDGTTSVSDMEYDIINSSSDADFLENEETTILSVENMKKPTPEEIKEGDFLLIQFPKKRHVVYYICNVQILHGPTEYQVSYLRKKSTSWTFVFPTIADVATADLTDVILKLPVPIETGGTSRTSSFYSFPVDFMAYNVL